MGQTIDNAVLMQRYCLSWRAGDFVTVTETWSDDVVAHIPGDHPFAGTARGKKDVLDLSVRLQKHAPRYPVDIHDWLLGEHHAVVLAHERAVRGEETLDTNRIYVFHLDAGKITEIWIYHDDQAAIDRFYG